MKAWFLAFTTLLLLISTVAPSATKHPRVAELEDKLIEDSTKQLKSRFPEIPFILAINIEPLRRGGDRDQASGEGERLPYLEVDEDEVRDEWDNPKASLYSLLNRVVRVTVSITVPETLSESEITDIQDVLNQSMRLIPGRDLIQVRKQNWQYGSGFNPQVVYLASGIGLLLFLIGLFVVSRMSVRRLASAIGELQSSSASDGAVSMVASSNHPPSAGPSADIGNERPSGELTVNDPMKMREVVQARLLGLIEGGGFPSLRDMMLLDEYAQSHPKALGLILSSLPIESKKEIFSLSPGPHWFEAFTEPGAIDGKVMEIIEKLVQLRGESNEREFELFLIQIWRMGDARVSFIKDLGSEEGLILLSYLPKSLAIPAGRAAFPGIWGGLLEHGYQWISFPPDRIKELYAEALRITPLHDYSELEKYMSDKDLVAYMRFADLDLERDVYEALDNNSLIVQLRPPFYVVFDANKELLEVLVSRMSIEDWAVVLFNVPRTTRSVIEGFFNPKQLFLYKEKMKSFDDNPPTANQVGVLRETIARGYHQLKVQGTNKREESVATTIAPREKGDAIAAEEHGSDNSSGDDGNDEQNVA